MWHQRQDADVPGWGGEVLERGQGGRLAYGFVWAAEKCWAAPNLRKTLLGVSARAVGVWLSPKPCPQSCLLSSLWKAGGSGPCSALCFHHPARSTGFIASLACPPIRASPTPALPPQPSGSSPGSCKGVPPRGRGAHGHGSHPSPPALSGAEAGRSGQPSPDLPGQDFPPGRSGSRAQGASRSRRRKWLIVSPAEKKETQKIAIMRPASI